MNEISKIIYLLPILIVAVIIHEYAHGKVAEYLGDPTARNMGRLTLNPKAHIDPFGSILLPLLLIAANSPIIFGMAKPVPVNPSYFKNPRKGMMYVGLAGPTANLLLAAASGFMVRLGLFSTVSWLITLLEYSVMINVILAVFNLIPIPPLDGSKVIAVFIPWQAYPTYLSFEKYGILFLFLLLFVFNRIFWLIIGPILSLFLRLFLGYG